MDRGWIAQRTPRESDAVPFAVAAAGGGWRIRLGDQEIDLEAVAFDGEQGWCRWEGRLLPFSLAREGKLFHVWVDGEAFAFALADRSPQRKGPAARESGGLTAQVPGKVLQVLVREGERVEAGQRLAIVESMKMEFVLCAPAAGVLRRVLVGPGQQVVAGTPLMDLEPG